MEMNLPGTGRCGHRPLQTNRNRVPFIQPVPFDRGHPFSQPYRADSFPRGEAKALASRSAGGGRAKARSGGVSCVGCWPVKLYTAPLASPGGVAERSESFNMMIAGGNHTLIQ